MQFGIKHLRFIVNERVIAADRTTRGKVYHPFAWGIGCKRWFVGVIVYLILALLLSACTTPGAGGGTAGPIYGPTWPHGTCDTVSTCWPVDGAPAR